MTGAISAEYGRFTGGVVSAITKSGGNEFSGKLPRQLPEPVMGRDDTIRRAAGCERDWQPGLRGDPGWVCPEGQALVLHGGPHVRGGPAGILHELRDRPSHDDPNRRAIRRKAHGSDRSGSQPRRFISRLYGRADSAMRPRLLESGDDGSERPDSSSRLPRRPTTVGFCRATSFWKRATSTRDLVFAGSGGDYVTTDHDDPRDVALGSWAILHHLRWRLGCADLLRRL